MNTRIIRSISAITASLLAASCIQVENVEEAWNVAKPDEALVGTWQGNGDDLCRFIKTDEGYLVTSGTNGLEGGCRSFESNGHKFVIISSLKAALLGYGRMEEDGKGGTLLRYTIEAGTLRMYSYDGDKLKEAINGGKVAGKVEDDSAKLTELDAATIRWLGEVAGGAGWDPQTYKKLK